jgi:hypothetical protein
MNPEDLLTDAFRDRTEHTAYPSTPLSTVAARAGAVRARRRRTTVLAAAAVVAVVAVPGALWLGRSPGASPQPSHELSSGPTTAPTGSPTVLADLPLGAKPGIDYLVGDTYVTMTGDRITSPSFAEANTATPARGGILAAVPPSSAGAMPPDGAAIYLVSGGATHKLGCGVDRFAMSTDGVQSAYWLADSCAVGPIHGSLFSGVNNTMGDAGPGSVASPVGAAYSPIGIVSQGVVVTDLNAQPTQVSVIAPDGTTSPIDALRIAGGSDENNDVVSGQLAGDPSTGAIVDASTGAVKWRAPGWALGQFSNDGRYVVAERLGHPQDYAVLDAATGDQITPFDRIGDQVSIRHVAWDFDDTVLAVASDSQGEAIVRFGLDGHPTLATEVRPDTDGHDVYRLATRS